MPELPKYIFDELNLLKLNHLNSFEALWNLKSDWFEEPNYRRNGWSGVSRIVLEDKNGNPHALFLKRQENHNYRSLLHPIIGIPTFRREFINCQNLKKALVPSLEVVFYDERKSKDGFQAVIITKALEGYTSFEDYFNLPPDNQNSKKIMENTAMVIRKLHNNNYRHGSLYPKHIFVNSGPGALQNDVRLIDLEKMKWLPIKPALMLNDISRLIRHRNNIKKEYIEHFLKCYLYGPGKNLINSKLSKKLFLILEKQK